MRLYRRPFATYIAPTRQIAFAVAGVLLGLQAHSAHADPIPADYDAFRERLLL